MEFRTHSLIGLIALFMSFQLQAQKEASWWHFGNNAVLHFDTSSSSGPVSNYTSPLRTFVGSSSISDSLGNLLFYTNGPNIWDKNNNLMPNGNQIQGNTLATQTAAIVPMPGNPGKYYLFTVDISQRNLPLHYSIVDMNQRNGLGVVDPATRNTRIQMPATTDHLTFTKKAGGGYWIAVHPKNSNQFWTFAVTQSGVSTTPVISTLGTAKTSWMHWRGHLKFSPDGSCAAMTELNTMFTSRIFLMDFNDSTGQFSNLKLDTTGGTCFGLEFSPNSDFLYISALKKAGTGTATYLYQYDAKAKNLNDLINSRYEEFVPGIHGLSALQLAPDKKIYGIRIQTNQMAVIHHPNRAKKDCKFSVLGPMLNSTAKTDHGLPSFPNFIFDECKTPTLQYTLPTSLCDGDTVQLSHTHADVVKVWKDQSPYHAEDLTHSGKYLVELSNSCGQLIDSLDLEFVSSPTVSLGNDTLLCKGDSLLFHIAPNNGSHWLWDNGDSNLVRVIKRAGNYSVSGYNQCGTVHDTITVDQETRPYLELGNDTSLCEGEVLKLMPVAYPSSIKWNRGVIVYSVDAYVSGDEVLVAEVSNACGIEQDTIAVTYRSSPEPKFNSELQLCTDKTLTVNTLDKYDSYQWSDGTESNTMLIEEGGAYEVRVRKNGCWASGNFYVEEVDCSPLLEMPNVFTPNGDGQNDVFKPISFNGILENQLAVFNRWGNQVYSSNQLPFEWNGNSISGGLLQSGVYFWVLEYEDMEGQHHIQKGEVTILSE